jgi:hypothetical protein
MHRMAQDLVAARLLAAGVASILARRPTSTPAR